MDTSKKYIEMCKTVKEIQDKWMPEYGDFYEDHHNIRKTIGTLAEKEFISRRPLPLPFIWIPRQDQLQEILSETCTLKFFIGGLHEFFDPESLCPGADGEYPPCSKCQETGKERRMTYKTMEQWWLAFVMSELYTKKWNGIEWVYDSSWRVPYHA